MLKTVLYEQNLSHILFYFDLLIYDRRFFRLWMELILIFWLNKAEDTKNWKLFSETLANLR